VESERSAVWWLARIVASAIALSVLICISATEVTAVIGYSHGVIDFTGTIWGPARRVLEGQSPYGDPSRPGFVPLSDYPPSAFLPLLPIGFLSQEAASCVACLALVAILFAAIAVTGLRDPRCYLLALLSAPVVITAVSGNMTGVLVLLIALLWRWRNQPMRAAFGLGACMAIKLFLAPVVLWLWFTGRRRAAKGSVAVASVAILGAWTIIGFKGFLDYPHLLSRASYVWQPDGPFLQGLLRQSGVGQLGAFAAGLVVAGFLIAAARHVAPYDDLGALALIVVAAIIAAPVSWQMNVGLLLPLLAIRHPRLSRVWLVVPLFWVHWWYSFLPYRSATLSVVTLSLLSLLTLAVVQPMTAERFRVRRSRLTGDVAV
jgi:hypothetical protein